MKLGMMAFALAVIENGPCRLLSRKKHRLTGYRDLREALVKAVNGEQVIVDGELVATDHLDRSNFAALKYRANQTSLPTCYSLAHTPAKISTISLSSSS